MDSFDSVSLTAINTSNTDKKHVVDIVDLNVQEIRPKFPLFRRKKIFRDCVLTFIKVLHNKFPNLYLPLAVILKSSLNMRQSRSVISDNSFFVQWRSL